MFHEEIFPYEGKEEEKFGKFPSGLGAGVMPANFADFDELGYNTSQNFDPA